MNVCRNVCVFELAFDNHFKLFSIQFFKKHTNTNSLIHMYVHMYLCMWIFSLMYVSVLVSMQFYASYDNKCYNKFLFHYSFRKCEYEWVCFLVLFFINDRILHLFPFQKRNFSICFISVWKIYFVWERQINSKTKILFLQRLYYGSLL